ncbi:hypothetical protein [Roseomonas sp. WA12]
MAAIREWLYYATAALDVLESDLQRGVLVEELWFAGTFSVLGGRNYLGNAVPLADRGPTPPPSLKDMLGIHSVLLVVLLVRFKNATTSSSRSVTGRFGLPCNQGDRVV